MGALFYYKLKTKVTLGVVEADTLNNLLQGSVDIGIFTVLHPVTNQVAEDATEVVMTGIAQERAGIGEHADEIAQQTQIGQGLHLIFHTDLVVVEPPGGAVLDLAGDLGTLETADQSAQLGIVRGIQGVEDGLGASAVLLQRTEELGDITAAGVLRDGIHTGIRALCLEDPLIVVTQAGVVQLHGNVQPGVGLA